MLLAALVACAQPAQPGRDTEDGFDEKPWEVQQARLPPYPEEVNLVQIYVSPTTTFRFFVDVASVSAGERGPIRYTLVARSPTGAENVSYEGIRCETHELKRYAFGRADRTWSQARSPRWAPITEDAANRPHAALAEDFFCFQRERIRTAEDAIGALRRGAFSGRVQ